MRLIHTQCLEIQGQEEDKEGQGQIKGQNTASSHFEQKAHVFHADFSQNSKHATTFFVSNPDVIKNRKHKI